MSNLVVTATDFARGIYNFPINLKQSTFPAGERYIKVEEESFDFLVNDRIMKYCNKILTVTPLDAKSDTIMDLILLSDAISVIDYRIKKYINFNYLPYGRQDRVCSRGESNSLEVFLDIISKYYDRIIAIDVHNSNFKFYSENFIKLGVNYKNDFIPIIKNEFNIPLNELDKESSCIVIPDKGAYARCNDASKELEIYNIMEFNKVRENGKISVTLEEYPKATMSSFFRNKTCIIVDDICDGGGTFLALAPKIKEYSPDANLILVVTHGIFSAGLDKLSKEFSQIYVHDNLYNKNRLSLI